MNSKKILLATYFFISYCFAESPLLKTYHSIASKIPNLTSLLNKKRYNTITFENIYKSYYRLKAFNIFIQHCNDQTLITFLIEKTTKQKSALSNAIFNTLLTILDTPYKSKEKEEKSLYSPVLELIHLAIGPGLTLLNLSLLLNEKLKQDYFNDGTKEIFGRHYTFFIESMYKTYVGIENEHINSTKNNIYLNKALHFAQQAYKTMLKYHFPLIFDDNTNQVNIVEWLTKQHSPYTDKLIQKIDATLTKDLIAYTHKIRKKTSLFKCSISQYQEFVYDIDFHSEMISILFKALYMHQNIDIVPWNNRLKEYIRSIADYLNTIQDNKIVDLMPEANLFRNYKNFLIQSIIEMLKPSTNEIKNSFKSTVQLARVISNARMQEIQVYIDNWIYKNITFKTENISLQLINAEAKTKEEITLKDLPSNTARLLFLYAEIVHDAYKPAIHQWKPLNGKVKDTVLITNKDSIFDFWKKEITDLYTRWLLLNVSANNTIKNLEPYLFMYTQKSLAAQIKENTSEEIIFFKDVPEQYQALLSEYEFLEGPKYTKDVSITLGIKNIQKSLPLLRNINIKTASVRWQWIFWRLANNKTVLDIVEGNGIGKTISILDDITNMLFFLPDFTLIDSKISKNSLLIQLKQAVEQLLANIYELQYALSEYLKSVLYSQKANPLHEAYSTTGKLLISAIQKTIDKTLKKWSFLKIKSLKKPAVDLKKLDYVYQKNKYFI